MIKVIIESPYKGDVDRNIIYARRLLHDCLVKYLTWDNPVSLTIVGTDYGLTERMWHGIERAVFEGREIIYREIGKNP